jgi:tetratricopeptide (TPR) repeat protein
VGREWSETLLREVAGLAEQDLTAHLAALTDTELLYARGLSPQTTYMFKHAFTQDAAYRSLLTARCQELHHRIAVTLEALFPDRLEELSGQLAYHYMEAAQGNALAQAIAYAMRAGQRHMALPAYAEAARFYQMALEALTRQEKGNEAQRCLLLLDLGEAQRKAGEHVQALETFQRAADSARRVRSTADLARAALEFEQATWAGLLSAEPAGHLLLEVLGMLGEQDSILRARVLGGLARALLFTGVLDQATTYARQAVEVARRVGDPSVLAFNLHVLLLFPGRPEETEERLMYATEMVPLAQEANEEELVLYAYGWRQLLLFELGDIEAAESTIEAGRSWRKSCRGLTTSTLPRCIASCISCWKGASPKRSNWLYRRSPWGSACKERV